MKKSYHFLCFLKSNYGLFWLYACFLVAFLRFFGVKVLLYLQKFFWWLFFPGLRSDFRSLLKIKLDIIGRSVANQNFSCKKSYFFIH